MKKVLKWAGIGLGAFFALCIIAAIFSDEPEVVTETVTETVEDTTKINELSEKLDSKNKEVEDLKKELKDVKKELEEAAAKLGEHEAKAKEAKKKEEEKKEKEAAKPVTLGAGTFYVGEDIPSGRYVVSTKASSGNFVVYDGSFPIVNEILGTDAGFAVNDVTVELSDGNKIEIMGLNSVTFKLK